jgi:hypothetical protein
MRPQTAPGHGPDADGAGRRGGYRVTATSHIAASAEQVWQVLVDLDAYERWNPFTPRVRSRLGVGDPVHLDVVLGPRRRTRSVNHVEVVEPPHRIVWSSILGHRWLLRTRREQRIEPLGDGHCRYTTTETFAGPLAPLVGLVSRRAVERGFAAVADGLRRRAEELAER